MITVIVCTYNRCQTLARALGNVAASVVPRSVEWEILVVDNNSTDRTCEVVSDLSRRYPGRIRYVAEPQQGLSFARNAGIRQSRGDILAFTDDDGIVDPGWLWNLTAKVHTGEWAGAGGRVIPLWASTIPRWWPRDKSYTRGPIVEFDLGDVAAPLIHAPIGANMAFRREMFEKYGSFRTDLGRRADLLLSGEDSDFGQRLLNSGERLLYEPSAVVHHPVAENRVRKQYLLSWFFGHGLSVFLQSGIPPETKWLFAGIPLHLFRRLARWTAQWLVSFDPSKRFTCRLSMWSIAGAISACYRMSRTAGRRNQAATTGHGKQAGVGTVGLDPTK